MIGYLVSLALHGPPVIVFMIAAYTRPLVVGTPHGVIDEPRGGLGYRHVVIAREGLVLAGTGEGGKRPIPAAGDGGPSGSRSRTSATGRRHRARRPLVAPSLSTLRPYAKAAPNAAIAAFWDEGEDDENPNEGPGAPGSGGGTAQHGGGGSGLGEGSGDGEGADDAPGGGLPSPPPPRASGPDPRHGRGRGAPMGRIVAEDINDDMRAPPIAGRAARIATDVAAYLRTYENFPSLPDALWQRGPRRYEVLLEICVTIEGKVADVYVRQSAEPEVDAFISASSRSWQYRPRLVEGLARPFCHLIRIVHERESPFSRRPW